MNQIKIDKLENDYSETNICDIPEYLLNNKKFMKKRILRCFNDFKSQYNKFKTQKKFLLDLFLSSKNKELRSIIFDIIDNKNSLYIIKNVYKEVSKHLFLSLIKKYKLEYRHIPKKFKNNETLFYCIKYSNMKDELENIKLTNHIILIISASYNVKAYYEYNYDIKEELIIKLIKYNYENSQNVMNHNRDSIKNYLSNRFYNNFLFYFMNKYSVVREVNSLSIKYGFNIIHNNTNINFSIYNNIIEYFKFKNTKKFFIKKFDKKDSLVYLLKQNNMIGYIEILYYKYSSLWEDKDINKILLSFGYCNINYYEKIQNMKKNLQIHFSVYSCDIFSLFFDDKIEIDFLITNMKFIFNYIEKMNDLYIPLNNFITKSTNSIKNTNFSGKFNKKLLLKFFYYNIKIKENLMSELFKINK